MASSLSDCALRAFVGMPQSIGTLRFFRRQTSAYVCYDSFGPDAEAITQGSYGDVELERIKHRGGGGVPSLRLNLALFGHVARCLLRSNRFRIAVFAAPFDAAASPVFVAGPGNLQPLISELRAMGARDPEGSSRDSVDASSLCTVFGPRRLDGSVLVGAAVLDTTQRTVKLFEFEDKSPDFGALEALVVQECAREVVYHEPSGRTPAGDSSSTHIITTEEGAWLRKLALRCGVLVDFISPSLHKVRDGSSSPSSTPPDLLPRLLGLGVGGQGSDSDADNQAALSEVSQMKHARRAASLLISHLGLLSFEPPSGGSGGGSEASIGSGGGEGFTLQVVERSGLLQYDASAERALMLFPSSSTASAPPPSGVGGCGPFFGSGSGSGGGGAFSKTSVFAVLDRTVSAGGARRLREWLRRPLTCLTQLQRRLAVVQTLVRHPGPRARLRERDALGKLVDLEKLALKLHSRPTTTTAPPTTGAGPSASEKERSAASAASSSPSSSSSSPSSSSSLSTTAPSSTAPSSQRASTQLTLRDVLELYKSMLRARAVLGTLEALAEEAKETHASTQSGSCDGGGGGSSSSGSGSGGGDSGSGVSQGSTGEASRSSLASVVVVADRFTEPLRSHLEGAGRFEALVEEVVDLDQIATSTGSAGSGSGTGIGGRSRALFVKPCFTPTLERLAGEMSAAESAIEKAADAAFKALKLKKRPLLKCECSEVHGCHLRVSKALGYATLTSPSNDPSGLEGKRILSVQKSGVLFTTAALETAASHHSSATAKYTQAQREVVAQVVSVTKTYSSVFAAMGSLFSDLDVLVSFAETASAEGWCKPTLVESSPGMTPSQPTAVMGHRGEAPAEADAAGTVNSISSLHSSSSSSSLPSSSSTSPSLILKGLRHPIVEASLAHLASQSNPFSASDDTSSGSVAGSGGGSGAVCVPNDVTLGTGLDGKSRIALVTGPNCGGKSSLIAAVGITQFLAQCGSFVPCSSAVIPLCHRIMARTGASDAPTLGVSSFMAEMLETATLLRRAGPGTLCLVDELGRGTATHDGLGIAWGVAKGLARSGASALFATHFAELTSLARTSVDTSTESGAGAAFDSHSSRRSSTSTSTSISSSSSLEDAFQNLHMAAVASGSKLTFLYELRPGACDRSFGVHVARLARFPPSVVAEADAFAQCLEQFSEMSSQQSSAATHPSVPRARSPPALECEGSNGGSAEQAKAWSPKRARISDSGVILKPSSAQKLLASLPPLSSMEPTEAFRVVSAAVLAAQANQEVHMGNPVGEVL